MLSAIHNHTGCGVFHSDDPDDQKKGAAYQDMVFRAAIQCVKQAQSSMRPARYGYGGGKSYINMNRDYQDELGGWVQAPNPERFFL